MHEAILSEKLAESRVRCNICQWRCRISPGHGGVCRMYQNVDGVLFNLNYALASSVAMDPIEKKPLYHFYPGSEVFSLGSWGCNFHCQHCQNWEISCVDVADLLKRDSRDLSPDQAIKLAKQYNAAGIAWTYNEPTMWFEYTVDSARLARPEKLYTVYVTNGYMTPEALDIIGPYLNAWRVDIKGFSDKFYQELARVPHWRGILEVAERAKAKWNMHVEVVTNVIPGMNDDDEQLEGIARWISTRLGELTPWHITRSYPQHKLMDSAATPLATLQHARDIGRAAGLKFVYIGNVPGNTDENTVCYSCGRTIIKRTGFFANVIGLEDSKCRFCGADMNVRMSSAEGRSQ